MKEKVYVERQTAGVLRLASAAITAAAFSAIM